MLRLMDPLGRFGDRLLQVTQKPHLCSLWLYLRIAWGWPLGGLVTSGELLANLWIALKIHSARSSGEVARNFWGSSVKFWEVQGVSRRSGEVWFSPSDTQKLFPNLLKLRMQVGGSHYEFQHESVQKVRLCTLLGALSGIGGNPTFEQMNYFAISALSRGSQELHS